MGWVKIRVPRTSQPQDACGLDWANPIARGVTDLVSPKVTGDLANVNAAILSPTPVGLGYKGNGTSSYFWRPKQGLMTSNLTMLTIVHGSAGGLDKRAFSIGSSASTTPIAALQSYSGSASKASFFVRSAGGQVEPTAAPDVFIDGKTSVLIGVVRNGVAELYIDGVLGATGGTNHNFSSFTMDRLAVGALLRASALSFSTAQVPLAGLWDRAFSAEEIVAISANPWQLFEPEEITIWVPDAVGAGGPATVIPIGVQANSAIGTPAAIGAAIAALTGVSATGSVGSPTATGGASIPATASPSGVSASSAVGTPAAKGAAKSLPAGVQATSAVGTPLAIGGSSILATVLPVGVASLAYIGSPVAIGQARAYPLGVQATGAVGIPIANDIGIYNPSLRKFIPTARNIAFNPFKDAYIFSADGRDFLVVSTNRDGTYTPNSRTVYLISPGRGT